MNGVANTPITILPSIGILASALGFFSQSLQAHGIIRAKNSTTTHDRRRPTEYIHFDLIGAGWGYYVPPVRHAARWLDDGSSYAFVFSCSGIL